MLLIYLYATESTHINENRVQEMLKKLNDAFRCQYEARKEFFYGLLKK